MPPKSTGEDKPRIAPLSPFTGWTQYSPKFISEYFDFMKTQTPTLNTNTSHLSLMIWLPSAFYLDWSNPQTFQKTMTDFTIWLPVALNPDKEKRDKYIDQIVQFIRNITFIASNQAEGSIVNNIVENIDGEDIKKKLKQ